MTRQTLNGQTGYMALLDRRLGRCRAVTGQAWGCRCCPSKEYLKSLETTRNGRQAAVDVLGTHTSYHRELEAADHSVWLKVGHCRCLRFLDANTRERSKELATMHSLKKRNHRCLAIPASWSPDCGLRPKCVSPRKTRR